MEYMEPYEKYKLEWMIEHGITLKEIYAIANEWAHDEELMDCYSNFEDYLESIGFSGMIWACYNEWLEYEGADYGEEN